MSEIFGKRLKKLRTERGYTQEELAEKANISVQNIERLEQCRPDNTSGPNLNTAGRLANALCVSLDELAGNSVSSDEELPENVEKKECMNKFTKEIYEELKKITQQKYLKQIRKRPLTKATLDGLELDQILVKLTNKWNEIHIFTKKNRRTKTTYDSYCTQSFVYEVVTRYVQGRDELKEKYNL